MRRSLIRLTLSLMALAAAGSAAEASASGGCPRPVIHPTYGSCTLVGGTWCATCKYSCDPGGTVTLNWCDT